MPARTPDPDPTRDRSKADLERENAALRDRLERIERERERIERERERIERERDRLRREVERLKEELEAARRAGRRQAAPFSKGPASAHPRRPGRRANTAYGRQGRRPVPSEIDTSYDVPVPAQCPQCQGAVEDTHVAEQYQEDLPPVRPLRRRFWVHIGRCRRCGRRVQGRHPLQTSDALGAAAVQLGPNAVATAAVLNKQLGLSFGKIAMFFAERFALRVVPSAIVRALHRTAAKALPTYAALVETVRTSPMVAMDETGWRVRAELQWLWVAVTPTTTVYAILPGRGFDEARFLLGPAFAGILVRDGWAPYRQFLEAAHQSCVTHLLHRARELQHDHPRAVVPGQVEEVLQTGLAVRDRYLAGEISAHGVAVARGQLMARLSTVLAQSTTSGAIRRFLQHLDREWTALFTFLFAVGTDATNWRAEQAIRGAVITRKVNGGGNRTPRGAITQAILASVIRTARQRGVDQQDVLIGLLQAPTPIIPPALEPRAGPH